MRKFEQKNIRVLAIFEPFQTIVQHGIASSDQVPLRRYVGIPRKFNYLADLKLNNPIMILIKLNTISLVWFCRAQTKSI